MRNLTAKLLTILSFAVLAGPLSAARYQIDPVHSEVSFKVKHMMVSKVQGRFDRFSGDFVYDEKDPNSWKTSAVIEAASINTSNANRDKHLQSADFFEVEKYPSISFKSARVSNYKDGKAKLEGTLNLHGVEKPVVLDLEVGGVVADPMGNNRAGFEANTRINRKDFGIIWSKTLGNGGMVIGEDVDINIRIEGIEQKMEKKPAEVKK